MVCRAERCIGQVTKCITAIVTIRTGAFVNDRSSPIIPLRVKPPTKKDQHNFKGVICLPGVSPQRTIKRRKTQPNIARITPSIAYEGLPPKISDAGSRNLNYSNLPGSQPLNLAIRRRSSS